MNYVARLTTHVEGFFGTSVTNVCVDHDWKDLHAPGLTCLAVPPTHPYNFHTYVSAGLAPLSPDEGRAVEYVLASPFATPEHAELFNMIAASVASRGVAYGLGNVIRIGRPWIYGSEADHLLVSLPYPYGPKLEEADAVSEGLRLYWLLPTYESEANYLWERDVEALERMFEEAEITFHDPTRAPVV